MRDMPDGSGAGLKKGRCRKFTNRSHISDPSVVQYKRDIMAVRRAMLYGRPRPPIEYFRSKSNRTSPTGCRSRRPRGLGVPVRDCPRNQVGDRRFAFFGCVSTNAKGTYRWHKNKLRQKSRRNRPPCRRSRRNRPQERENRRSPRRRKREKRRARQRKKSRRS